MIFVTHSEAACRTGRQHGFTAACNCLSGGVEIDLRVTGCLAHKAVGNFGNSAAAFAIKKAHAYAHSIEQLDKSLAERRIVIVDIASVEIAYLPVETSLVGLGTAVEPRDELSRCVSGEAAMAVDAECAVHDILHRFHGKRGVNNRSADCGDRPHYIGLGKHGVAQRRT